MAKKQITRKYVLYCEPCNFKKILDKPEDEDLIEIKKSMVPGGYPKLDIESGETKNRENLKRSKQYKCPKCGRGVTIKRYNVPIGRKNDKKDKT